MKSYIIFKSKVISVQCIWSRWDFWVVCLRFSYARTLCFVENVWQRTQCWFMMSSLFWQKASSCLCNLMMNASAAWLNKLNTLTFWSMLISSKVITTFMNILLNSNTSLIKLKLFKRVQQYCSVFICSSLKEISHALSFALISSSLNMFISFFVRKSWSMRMFLHLKLWINFFLLIWAKFSFLIAANWILNVVSDFTALTWTIIKESLKQYSWIRSWLVFFSMNQRSRVDFSSRVLHLLSMREWWSAIIIFVVDANMKDVETIVAVQILISIWILKWFSTLNWYSKRFDNLMRFKYSWLSFVVVIRTRSSQFNAWDSETMIFWTLFTCTTFTSSYNQHSWSSW